jgi:hypothetical protein
MLNSGYKILKLNLRNNVEMSAAWRNWESLEELGVTGGTGSHWRNCESLEELRVTGGTASHWRNCESLEEL